MRAQQISPDAASHRPNFSIGRLFNDVVRLLSFRRPSSLIAIHWRSYLIAGLVFTWLAGIGRYWDNPRAALWQHAGLGSVGYVFSLALVVWLLRWPLRPRHWSYRNVLVFVTLTSPPALLYAIPVERFMSLPAAQSVNAWFLGIVALWRVALLVIFLRRVGGLSGAAIAIASLLPLVMIVVALTALNLEHVVFNIMAGIRPEQQSPNDLSYTVVITIAVFSMLAAPFLLLAYLCLVFVERWSPQTEHEA